ncbi:MAG: tRNA epoxyqueuosine(34) reductase QueG [Deferribacteres bacterium]|nr:tRNA epoxyqueuosine(34) reductase QueG [candidate division KSB1 bacterium]MCB9501262.1 tRNA epoxyqueuosine(34) reductase QueG [Deferribacteres bacterium]
MVVKQTTSHNYVSLLREKAKSLGFELFGIARIEQIPAMSFYAEWLNKGYHAGMEYLARHCEKKSNPGLLVENAKSIIVCGKNYNTAYPLSIDKAKKSQAWISRYAWGDDYHEILKNQIAVLNAYWLNICENKYLSRYYIDTGPVLERSWAEKAGIGWRGKNTCIINRDIGSWLFLAVIITDAELPSNSVSKDFCGTCTACIDACPTNAIRQPYLLDSNLCISYHTIENKNEIPVELQNRFGRQIFGCDICQDVCPWNRKAQVSVDVHFQPRAESVNPDLANLLQLDEQKFREKFKKSPIKRAKYSGFMRNVLIAAENSGIKSLVSLVKPFLINDSKILVDQAQSTLKALLKNEIQEV